MLTDKQVRALKPVGKDVFKLDGAGLYLRVSIHGTKTFVYRKKVNGKNQYTTIGEYGPSLTLADARRKVGELQGVEHGNRTVSQAVEAYLASLDYLRPEQVKRRLDTDVIPEIGKKRIDRVTTEDLTNLLGKIVDRGSPVAANRTLGDLRHLFSYSYAKGWISNDPSLRITRKVVGGKEKSREVVPPVKQVQKLIAELKTDRWEPRTRVGLALCLLLGQRASEILGINKDEINGHWWTIPAERTKTGRPQKVYLSRPTRHLLKMVDYTLGMEHTTLSRPLNRAGYDFTPHDFRRLLSSTLAEEPYSVPLHVIELMLGHRLTGVLAVYQRGEFLSEKKAAWTLWARYLLKLHRTDNLAAPGH